MEQKIATAAHLLMRLRFGLNGLDILGVVIVQPILETSVAVATALPSMLLVVVAHLLVAALLVHHVHMLLLLLLVGIIRVVIVMVLN